MDSSRPVVSVAVLGTSIPEGNEKGVRKCRHVYMIQSKKYQEIRRSLLYSLAIVIFLKRMSHSPARLIISFDEEHTFVKFHLFSDWGPEIPQGRARILGALAKKHPGSPSSYQEMGKVDCESP